LVLRGSFLMYHRLKDSVAPVVKTSRQRLEDEIHTGSDDGSAQSGSSGTRRVVVWRISDDHGKRSEAHGRAERW
jgi:hypothetical protein